MNNGKFLTLLDLGRLDLFLRNRFWQKMKAKHWYPVVVAETITFRKSLVLGQKFEIQSRVIGWDAISYYIEQRFVVAGEIYASAMVRGRFLSKAGKVLKPHEVMEAITGSNEASPKVPKWVLDWAETTSLPRGKEPAPSLWD
jgi:acyl-CoA thioesterase FadM